MVKKKISLIECQHCVKQESKWFIKCPNCASGKSFLELNQEGQYCPFFKVDNELF